MSRPAPVSEQRTIFLGNIAFDISEDELKMLLSSCGRLISLRLVTERDSGKRKGFGFAEFADTASAVAAVRNLNDYELHGRTLRVSMAEQDTKVADPAPSRKRKGFVGGAPVAMAGSPSVPILLPSLDGAQIMKLSEAQTWEIVSQMKAVVDQNVDQARQMLISNPAVGLAILKAQCRLGMVTAEAIDAMLQTAPWPPPTPAMPTHVPPALGEQHGQQQALLEQVMQLTPLQIEELPPEQRAQVEALRRACLNV